MNSHASPINLQSSGQTVVVGHHRGFSQPSSSNAGDPWFLQSSHQMPPTAPTRQNKRPTAQSSGSILQNAQHPQLQQAVSHTQLTSNSVKHCCVTKTIFFFFFFH